ncbi:DUF1573 domain-containing protein [Geobacter sulfurreducens]|uniref:DUF1573 domain-containing protein n=1 Tax=Geobacter sulfurreducens TaxID=35554 RepID=UPI002B60A73B|nr:DUF1573 domain-containing protein [Geobacter sulfurreducens]HML79908.1 DUF1573 domain-containing protein [Geobacter sulfurreducens]
MRQLLAPLLTIILLLQCVTAAFAAPTLSVDKPFFDFGTIPQGKKLDHVFTLKNKGDSPLSIVRTKSSCGCTVISLPRKTIEPGGSVELKTTFDSTTFGGKVTKTITVETNDPANPNYTLTLTGVVSEVLVVVPRQLNLGQIKAGTSGVFTVTMENKGNRPVKITSVTSPMPQVKATAGKQTIKPGESTSITMSVAPRPEDRFLSGFIIIKTDMPGKPEITVPVYGSVSK